MRFSRPLVLFALLVALVAPAAAALAQEPATVSLGLLGLAALMMRRRRA